MSPPEDPRAFILQQLDGEWQKIATALIFKLSRDKPVIITHQDLADLHAFMAADRKLLTWGHYDSIELRLVTSAEAERLAEHVKAQGGSRAS